MLIDKSPSSDYLNGHWFEADWLYSKRDALSSNRKVERLMVRGSRVALKHVIHDMKTRTLVMELRRRAIKRWVAVVFFSSTFGKRFHLPKIFFNN